MLKVKTKVYCSIVLISILLSGCCEDAQVSSSPQLQGNAQLDLWPKGHLGDTDKPREVVKPSEGDNIIRLTDVYTPSMTVYRPVDAKGVTPAVLVCPGGGYNILAIDLEGTEIAEWLNSIGITAVVLKYSVPDNEWGAFNDGQRAMALIRHNAKDWEIDPQRVGIIGFSAGANLAARLSTNFEEKKYDHVDKADKENSRPDFAMLVYPWLRVENEDDELAEEFVVTSKTPRTILIHAQDDWVKPENSILYFLALKKAKVKSELHVFPSGGHGYGLRPSEHAVSGWPKLCKVWMQKMGIINSN